MKNNLPIEEQVITQPQAEELAEIFREAGVEPPGSLWVWEWADDPVKWRSISQTYIEWPRIVLRDQHDYLTERVPAYTGDELGALLTLRPTYFLVVRKLDHALNDFLKKGVSFEVRLEIAEPDKLNHLTNGITIAQAKADLAIRLLEKRLIKLEEFRYA